VRRLGHPDFRALSIALKFQFATPEHNAITGYGRGYVVINAHRYERSLIVTPSQIIEDRLAGTFEQLSTDDFEFIRSLKPEIVLLGTGGALRFPSAAITQCLAAARVGLEVMDTNAACRTYNILSAEGREVAAAILIA
jgi:uncharacterized protein